MYWNCTQAYAVPKADNSLRLVTLKALQQQHDFKGVLDVDQNADALLNELGVTELGVQGIASKLASATTKKKRPGFVGPQQLAKNWKICLHQCSI